MKTKEDTKAADILVAIGRVGSAAGLRGEFRINLYAEASGNLKEGKNLLFRHVPKISDRSNESSKDASEAQGETKAVCLRVRYQGDKPVVTADGIDDRNKAEELRGMEVCIFEDELDELPNGEHYVRDIVGCEVVNVAGGGREVVGSLKDVIQNTAQSVLEVETAEGRIVLIPAVDEFMRNIDEDARLIEVELIPGFM